MVTSLLRGLQVHGYNSSQQVLLTCFDIFILFSHSPFLLMIFSPHLFVFLKLYFITKGNFLALHSQVLFGVLRPVECDVFKTWIRWHMQGKQPVRSVFQLVDGRSLCLMQLVQAVSATLNMLTSYKASQAPGSFLCEVSYHRQLCDNGISMAFEHKDE